MKRLHGTQSVQYMIQLPESFGNVPQLLPVFCTENSLPPSRMFCFSLTIGKKSYKV